MTISGPEKLVMGTFIVALNIALVSAHLCYIIILPILTVATMYVAM